MRMMTRIGTACALGLTIAAGIAAYGADAQAQTDVIKERQDGFQAIRKQLGAVKSTVESGGPADAVVAPAEAIAAYAARIPGLFPQGSETGGDTKALATVWSDRTGFEAHAGDLETKALALAEAGRGGDMAAVGAAFGAVGKSCGACHQDYRGK